MHQLFKKIQELAPEVKEVRNVRDRASNLASGFAFAELPSEELATALLKRLEEESLEVDGHRLLATYAHHGSFMPTHSYSQWSASSIVNAEGKKVYLQYWDENAYCSTFPSPPTPPEPANSKPKKKPTKKKGGSMLWIETSHCAKLTRPVPDNIEDALSAFYADVPKAGAETGATPSAADAADALIQSVYAEMEAAEQQQQEPPSAKPSEAEAQPKEPKKTVLTIASKKASVNIQKWAAVSGSVDTDEDEEGGDEKAPELVVVPTQEEVNRTHVDLAINACLLCQRQFPSEDKLRKHQAASDLHKVRRDRLPVLSLAVKAHVVFVRPTWKSILRPSEKMLPRRSRRGFNGRIALLNVEKHSISLQSRQSRRDILRDRQSHRNRS